MDELYDECTTANSTLERLREDDQWKDKDSAAKWIAVYPQYAVGDLLHPQRPCIHRICGEDLFQNGEQMERQQKEVMCGAHEE